MSGYEFNSAVLVFSVMGCLSLGLFLFLHLKNRALVRIPKDTRAKVFDRTFAIFNPYPEQRGMLHSYLSLLPFVALVGALAIAYLSLMILAMGLLGFIALILCLTLIRVDEAFEICNNSRVCVKAVNSNAGFGVGDLAVLLVLKRILPKLRAYYLSLSVAFFASSVLLPYVIPAAIMVLAQFASAVINFSAPAGVFVAYTTTVILAAAETIAYMIARKAKSKIFGFPSSHSPISAMSAAARSWISCTEGFSYILEQRPEENY